jgi:folate receptor
MPLIIKKEDKAIKRREERYFKIPICKSECEAWFQDCKEDYTCRDDWYKGFQWKNGTDRPIFAI